MGAEIRLSETLTDDEREALYGWGENIFGIEDAAYRWRSKDYHFITEDEGRALSYVGVLKTSVDVGGREITVGGVGGIVTRPEARGRHLVHAAMRRVSEFICRDLGAEFGALFCLPHLAPFYERQGWSVVRDDVEIEGSDGRAVWPYRMMVRPCGDREWPAGRVEVGLPW